MLDIFFWGVLGIGAVALIILAFSWVITRWWCRPKRVPTNETPADYLLPYESVSFNSQGSRLKGWFVPTNSNQSPRPVIILSHGWSKNAANMLPLAQRIFHNGYSILLFDARGHGMSENGGPMNILKMAQDLLAAIDFMKTRADVDMKQIGVLGHSLGGGSALLAASMDQRIRAVVSTSAFADPLSVMRDGMKGFDFKILKLFTGIVKRIIEHWLGTTVENVAPKNRIGQLHIPVLLVHGGSDRFIPPSDMDELYAHSDTRYTERLLIPGRRHFDVLSDEKFTKGVIDFFQVIFGTA